MNKAELRSRALGAAEQDSLGLGCVRPSDRAEYLPCKWMTSFLVPDASPVDDIYADQKPFPLLNFVLGYLYPFDFLPFNLTLCFGTKCVGCILINNAEVTDFGFKMKLCSIKWGETKAYNSMSAADISAKIIFHALISTVSFSLSGLVCSINQTHWRMAGESYLNQMQVIDSSAQEEEICVMNPRFNLPWL